MSPKHANISIFIPHLGCTHRCSFCNQVHITGKSVMPTEETIKSDIENAQKSKNYNPKNTEIAFFGGSFTAIDKSIFENYLKIAKKYIDAKTVSGIRISTRPDAISPEILDILKNYGVTSIELGAQSMDNEVLLENMRGHTAEDVENASHLIADYGFSLGLQMMTGLYCDNDEKALQTAQKIAALNPRTVRIYPTLLLKSTYLEKLFGEGKYKPQTLSEAIKLCAALCEFFESKNITVIRTGLHSVDNDNFLGGPWHPAFGELVKSRILRNKAEKSLKDLKKGSYTVFVNPRDISKFIGQSRENIQYFKNLGYEIKTEQTEEVTENQLKIIERQE